MTKKSIQLGVIGIFSLTLLGCSSQKLSNGPVINHSYCAELTRQIAESSYTQGSSNNNSMMNQLQLRRQYVDFSCDNPMEKVIKPSEETNETKKTKKKK